MTAVTCALARQDFTPRVHVTASDFASITKNGELCDETGQLGPAEFEDVMRKQARRGKRGRGGQSVPL